METLFDENVIVDLSRVGSSETRDYQAAQKELIDSGKFREAQQMDIWRVFLDTISNGINIISRKNIYT